MNTVVLRRRLSYICAMVVLLIPLYFLGSPSVRNLDGTVRNEGGTLAQLRTNYDLGQGDLGEIDPASESMRLATLGLRGVAATILWQKAEFYKREQYWDRLSATLNQIAALQPHFIEIWKFQAHNMSYNVSSEFDNYRHRYQWVKKGIDYLVKGSKHNRKRTELPYELGWFYGNKMGMADERVQFRELYRNDQDFHTTVAERTGIDVFEDQRAHGPDKKPDNWLSGRLWYLRAYDMVASGLGKEATTPMIFFSKGPQWLMKYAEAIQKEGYLGAPAQVAWENAGNSWQEFGQIQIVTTWGDSIYLGEFARANKELKKARAEFEEFCGPTWEKMLEDAKSKLTEEQLAAYELDPIDRNFEEVLAAEKAASVLTIPANEVARVTPDEIRVEALRLAADLDERAERIHHIDIYRNQLNYGYWVSRCESEQTDESIDARTSMYEAEKLLEKGELDGALASYEKAFASWSELYRKFPAMMIDDSAETVAETVEGYRQLLDENQLPDDFPLNKFLQFRFDYENQLTDTTLMNVINYWSEEYPDRDFLEEMMSRRGEGMAQQAADANQDADSSGNSNAEEKEASSTTEEPADSPEGPSTLPPVEIQDAESGIPPGPKPAELPTKEAQEISLDSPDEGKAPGPAPK